MAPKHLKFMEEVVKPKQDIYKTLSSRYTSSELIEAMRLTGEDRSWKSLCAKSLRKDDGLYGMYIRVLGAIIDVFNPPKDEVIEWMSHSCQEQANILYDYTKGKTDTMWSGKNKELLELLGVKIDFHKTAKKVLDSHFVDNTSLIPGLRTTMPEFMDSEDIDMMGG